MHRNVLRVLTVIGMAVPLALGACKRSEEAPTAAAPPPVPETRLESPPPAAPAPFRVTSVEVGNAIGPDKRVTTPTGTLAPTDTVYVSVATDGTASRVALTARWTYEDGQVVQEAQQEIAPEGPAVSEFHIDSPDGLPAGRYRVEILADGSPAGSREFEVR